MFKTTMEVDAALGAMWRMPRGNLVNSLVRSFVRTCIRTAGQSQRVAVARAAARAIAAKTTAAARTPVRPSARAATPVFGTGLVSSSPVSSSLVSSGLVSSSPVSSGPVPSGRSSPDLSRQKLPPQDGNHQGVTPDAFMSGNRAFEKAAAQRLDIRAPFVARVSGVAPGSTLATEPAFARVSSRRGAQPATLNPVRIYSTPSRTVMVGNLNEVARFLDDSIERERARLALRVQMGNVQAAAR